MGQYTSSYPKKAPRFLVLIRISLLNYKQLQNSQVNDITVTIKPQQEEIVSMLRHAIRIAEDRKNALDYCETRVDQSLSCVTSMVRIKGTVIQFEIKFPYTGQFRKDSTNVKDVDTRIKDYRIGCSFIII